MIDSDVTIINTGGYAIWLCINGEGDILGTVTKTVTRIPHCSAITEV